MEYLLPDILKLLIDWIVAKPSMAIFRFVQFCTTTAVRHRRMVDYTLFTRREYTNKGQEVPTLILRIQNDYIREYNEAANYWAGRMLLLKTYPQTDGKPKKEKHLILSRK